MVLSLEKNIKIGIIGKAGRSEDLPENLKKSAKIIGKELAKKRVILVTGACMGVPDIAAKETIKNKGVVLAYSPAKDLREHIEPPISYPYPAKNEILIFTGFGKLGRNLLSILESDGIIVIGGGIGTLNEISIAYHEGKVIGILQGVGGIGEKIFDLENELKKGTKKEIKAKLIKDKNPKRLIKKVIEEIIKNKEEPRKEIPLTFKNKNKKELVGILHLPQKEKPPLVLICHGFQKTKTDRKFVFLARELAKAGFAIFRFDFEGCGDSEGDPKEITFLNEVEDLKMAINFVLANSDLNSKNLAIVADSSGAIVASLFAKDHPVKTLCFWNPAFNQKKLLKKCRKKKD